MRKLLLATAFAAGITGASEFSDTLYIGIFGHKFTLWCAVARHRFFPGETCLATAKR